MALIRLDEPTVRPKTPPRGFALFALGFRPFYLAAALWAALVVPLWIAQFNWALNVPTAVLPLYWHAHEMLYGFAAAVIVGFLFTAGQNWTGLATPTGGPLAGLALVWLGGRLAMLFAPPILAATIDILFLPLAAIALGRVLWRAKSKRNYFIVVLLLALALANTVFHLRASDSASDPLQPLFAALSLIVLLCTIIAGRIVPNFTVNALRGTRQFKHVGLDRASICLTALALGLVVAQGPALLITPIAGSAAILQAVRCWGWNPWATRHTPILWILHLAHAWIPLALAAFALVSLGLLPVSPVWHALGVGTVGGLIIGMITRTALGHTGRLLKASRLETTAYSLVLIAAVVRSVGPIIAPEQLRILLEISACCWSVAFLAYLWRYVPFLWNPRVDGKKG